MSDILTRERQAFGYAWILPICIKNGRICSPETFEICLRHEEKEIILRVDLTDIDRREKVYDMAVYLAEGDPEYSSLFFATVRYTDGTWCIDFDSTCISQKIGPVFPQLTNLLHTILYRLVLDDSAPEERDGIINGNGYSGFSTERAKWIEKDSCISIEGVVSAMQIFATPHK